MKSLLLFLGSGVSYDSGAPTVGTITSSLLDSEWSPDNAQRYWPGKNGIVTRFGDNLTPRLQEFLRVLKAHVDDYFAQRDEGEATYEDLFYLIQQMYNEVTRETRNPAMDLFVKKIQEGVKHLCDDQLPFKELARRSIDMIRWVVFHSLRDHQQPVGMDLICNLADSDQVQQLNIVTLNQDVLVERLLESKGIEYTDGFILRDEVPRFDTAEFEKKGVKIRLFKLHGSIDWRMHTRYGCIRVPLNKSEDLLRYTLAKDSGGRVLPDLPLLIGTYNKGREYSYGIYEVLFYDWFRRLLREHHVIVMSGYGGRDYEVSLRIRNWLWHENQKLVMLYRDPETQARGMLSYVEHLPSKLVLLNKWLSGTTADDLLSLMQDS